MLAEAEELYRKIFKLNRGMSIVCISWGRLSLQGAHDEAVRQIDLALKINPNFAARRMATVAMRSRN